MSTVVPGGGIEQGKGNIALEPAHPDLSLGGLQALRTRGPTRRHGCVSYESHCRGELHEAAVGAAGDAGGPPWPWSTRGQSQGLAPQRPPGGRRSRGSRNRAWRPEAAEPGGAFRTRAAALLIPAVGARLRSALAPAPGKPAGPRDCGMGGE